MQLRELYATVRIALAPIFSGAGVKGKVAEAWLHQVPIVVTPVAAEGMHGIHKQAFLVGNSSREFTQQIGVLFSDCDVWREISYGGTRILKEHFSYELAKNSLLRGVDELLQKKLRI